MSGWRGSDRANAVTAVTLPEGVFLPPDSLHSCRGRWKDDAGWVWWCTRLTERGRHKGRHMDASVNGRVYAAWPGDHEPTAADLTDGGA